MVHGLGLHASTTEGIGLIPGLGTKILHASRRSQKKKKEKKNMGEGHQENRALILLTICTTKGREGPFLKGLLSLIYSPFLQITNSVS